MIRFSNWSEELPAAADEEVSPVRQALFRKMMTSPETFSYPSVRELNFELRMRQNTIAAASALNASGVAFTTFRNSRCNPIYWIREPNGAFRLRPGQSPAAAIRDIFRNGRLYGFECATAMLIVFYKAALDTVGDDVYNRLFGNTYLYHWNADRDLGLTTILTRSFIPGDCLYFDNPEVSMATPWWQGENAIYMGGNRYYGHGIGIVSAQRIIEVLNSNRRRGATISAFLTDQVTRPNYVYLSQVSGGFPGMTGVPFMPGLPGSVYFRAAIGSSTYLLG